MAHFEAKYHTLRVERMTTRFLISKTFKNPAKVTNGQIVARQIRQKTFVCNLQTNFKRFSHKLDPKCYKYLKRSVHKVHYRILEQLFGGDNMISEC